MAFLRNELNRAEKSCRVTARSCELETRMGALRAISVAVYRHGDAGEATEQYPNRLLTLGAI